MQEKLMTYLRYDSKTLRGIAYRSLFLHAWDLAEGGSDKVMHSMSEAGLNVMCLAATYHSGWFLHPGSPAHRAFMAESGVCYFKPDKSYFGDSRLFPKTATLAKKRDWMRQAGKRAQKHGLRLVAWVIGMHNTRAGTKFPELTQRNVYNDSLPHALCPANDEVREYLVNLCRNLACEYPVWGLQLESFGWMSFAHGHHHERDLVGLSSLEQQLMSLCVCRHCSQKAARAGVDVLEVKRWVKEVLEGAMREAPDRPKNHPRRMEELEAECPELLKFNGWRKTFLNSLVTAIKIEALKATDCRLLLQSEFDPALADAVDGFACGAYGKTGPETLSICRQAKTRIPRDWNGILQCFIQLGAGIPANERQLREIISAVQNAGCNGINFYNRSESPPRMLRWLANILPAFACENN
jgi:hypothetical protein